MKLEVKEIATITLKDDEYLIIRLPEDVPRRHAQNTIISLMKIFPPEYAKRTLVYRGEIQLDKVKFLEDEK